MTATPQPSLSGKRILIAEDEYLLAQDVSSAFRRANADVVGMAATPAQAMALLDRQGPDLAVLDINLNGVAAYDLAAELDRRGTAYFFVSGYRPETTPPAMRHVPLLLKPYEDDALLAMAGRLLAR